MNDFEKMCNRLEKAKKKGCPLQGSINEYLCALLEVNEYVDGDRDKLLKLKAEAEQGDFKSYAGVIISAVALIVSVFNYIIFVLNETTDAEWFVYIMIFITLLCTALVFALIYYFAYNFSATDRWREYVKLAIQEVECNIDKKKKHKKIKRNMF